MQKRLLVVIDFGQATCKIAKNLTEDSSNLPPQRCNSEAKLPNSEAEWYQFVRPKMNFEQHFAENRIRMQLS